MKNVVTSGFQRKKDYPIKSWKEKGLVSWYFQSLLDVIIIGHTNQNEKS